MYKVIGYRRSTGVFEKDGKSYPYDNWVMHSINDDVPQGFVGQMVETFNLAVAKYPEPVGSVGKTFEVYYTKRGKVAYFKEVGGTQSYVPEQEQEAFTFLDEEKAGKKKAV